MGEGKWLCLPGSSIVGVHGRRRRSRSKGHRHRSLGLPDNKRGGRNNKYKAIIAIKSITRQMNGNRCSNVGTMHVARSGNSSEDESPVPGDYRTGCRRGGSWWTSDKREGGVSGLVELFWKGFVFGINSSGYFYSTGQIIGQTVQRGTVRCSVC